MTPSDEVGVRGVETETEAETEMEMETETDEYRGWPVSRPQTMLRRIRNFLADNDSGRTPRWDERLLEIEHCLDWLSGQEDNDDDDDDEKTHLLEECRGMVNVHRVWDRYYRDPDVLDLALLSGNNSDRAVGRQTPLAGPAARIAQRLSGKQQLSLSRSLSRSLAPNATTRPSDHPPGQFHRAPTSVHNAQLRPMPPRLLPALSVLFAPI